MLVICKKSWMKSQKLLDDSILDATSKTWGIGAVAPVHPLLRLRGDFMVYGYGPKFFMVYGYVENFLWFMVLSVVPKILWFMVYDI